MTEVKIQDSVIPVLKGMSKIYQSMVIRGDYLYTKFVPNPEEKGSKGTNGVIVEYKLPEGVIKLEKPFGIIDVNHFISVINSFEPEKLSITQEGNTLIISDSRKKVTYFTQTVDALPKKEASGDQIWENAKPTIIFALTEVERERIKSDLSVLSVDKLSLKGDNEVLKLHAEDSLTGNSTIIELDKQYSPLVEGEFTFSNCDIFDVILNSNYKLEVREADHNGKTIRICKFISKEINGLEYTLVSI